VFLGLRLGKEVELIGPHTNRAEVHGGDPSVTVSYTVSP